METEWEATFWPIDKDELRGKLMELGGTCIHKERLMRRVNFFRPETSPYERGFVRVRDEGDVVTLTFKQTGSTMEEQKEIECKVSDFDTAVMFLEACGLKRKSYQETKRETWRIGGVEVMLDEWPWLPPFVELEAPNEEMVRELAERMGFDWSAAHFGSADHLYEKHYGVDPKQMREIPELLFTGENPILKLPKV